MEVKLSNNPELRNRKVLSQILDYASSISSLTTNAFLQVLGFDGTKGLITAMERFFPEERDLSELA